MFMTKPALDKLELGTAKVDRDTQGASFEDELVGGSGLEHWGYQASQGVAA